MDSAYNAPEIAQRSHAAIIDPNPRRGGNAEAEARIRRCAGHTLACAGHTLAEDIRFKERSAAERVNSALKDSYGDRFVHVSGHDKVFCYLMLLLASASLSNAS
jgi:hypothetical protein